VTEIWFDTRAGDVLVGRAAAADRIDEAGPDIVPLPELLTRKDFPYKYGDYERVPNREFTDEDFLAMGRWALSLVQERLGDRQPLSTAHISRLSALGLMPHLVYVGQRFDSFSNFKRQIGSPIRYDRMQYANWSTADFVAYAQSRIDHLGHLPTMGDYQQWFTEGVGPSFRLIEDRLGGLKPLHDLLGYPDISRWEEDDFIDWGVRAMKANKGRLTLITATVLAHRRRGPSPWTIDRDCKSWSRFKQLVTQAYAEEQSQQAEKLDWYAQLFAAGKLPEQLRLVHPNQLAAVVGRYRVICDCVPNLPPARKISLSLGPSSGLIAGIRRYASAISPGYIEMIASSKGLYDDIWPLEEYKTYLRVSDEEYEQQRIKFRTSEMRRKRRRKLNHELKAS
jgi:hypothetical protein